MFDPAYENAVGWNEIREALSGVTKYGEKHADAIKGLREELRQAHLQVSEQQKKLESYETYIQVLLSKLRGEKPVPIEQVIEELGQAEKRLSGDQKVAGPGDGRGEAPTPKENPSPATTGDCSSSEEREYRRGDDVSDDAMRA